MIRVSLLLLACLSIVTADSDDDVTVPACETQSPNDVHFDLSRMGLTTLRKGFISGNSVTCINLAGNAISKLETGTFDDLPGLLYLNLAASPISFEDFMKMNFPALRALVLDGPFDQYVTGSQEHDPTSSYYQEMYQSNDYRYERHESRLDKVSNIFLPRLEKLSYRNYKGEAVLRWLRYINAPNLTHLNVGSNGFSEILLPENLIESLIHLNVDGNQVHMFALSLPKLRYLSIDRNEIHNLCMHSCDWNSLSVGDMPALEYLSLADNKIVNIEANAFGNNIHLKSLNFNGNEITSLPRDLFHNVTLRILKLARNKLVDIPDVCGLAELEQLDLGENRMEIIDEATFCSLTHLRSIDLHQNQLSIVPDGTFAHLPALTELDLSRNRLTTLAPNWIGPGQKVASLKLDGNLFSDVANMSLGALEKVDYLSISDNPLRILTVGALTNLPPDTQIRICSAPLM